MRSRWKSEHHHHVRVAQALLHRGEGLDAEPVHGLAKEGPRCHHPHLRSKCVEREDVRSGDSRMHDVAANRDGEAFEASFVATDRHRIQKRLGRMFVAAVTGIDDGAIDLLRATPPTGGMVANHKEVGAHGVEGDGRVSQRLALLDRRGGDRHVHHTSAPSHLPASSKELCVRVEASKE